ncbi:hypothetical protein PCL_01524 [Purpureocillium lilacinum]|uniref:Uncharacterized protein n=1 Tax=Purpureocillium lilacinum TaxID=33203 RepID=A0A2U3E3S2_PURLI|nr:hypothetical protein PCL_01524 [Purpureocillium lilacinum]
MPELALASMAAACATATTPRRASDSPSRAHPIPVCAQLVELRSERGRQFRFVPRLANVQMLRLIDALLCKPLLMARSDQDFLMPTCVVPLATQGDPRNLRSGTWLQCHGVGLVYDVPEGAFYAEQALDVSQATMCNAAAVHSSGPGTRLLRPWLQRSAWTKRQCFDERAKVHPKAWLHYYRSKPDETEREP